MATWKVELSPIRTNSAHRRDEPGRMSPPGSKGRRDVNSPSSPDSASSYLNSTRRSTASTAPGRVSPSRDHQLSITDENGRSSVYAPKVLRVSANERDGKMERKPGSIVPKAFNEKDFEDFLGRQNIRPQDGPLTAVLRNLRKVLSPLPTSPL